MNVQFFWDKFYLFSSLLPWRDCMKIRREMWEKIIIQSDYKIFSKEYNNNYNRLKPYSITTYTPWHTENNINIKEEKINNFIFGKSFTKHIFSFVMRFLFFFFSSTSTSSSFSRISFFYCLTYILGCLVMKHIADLCRNKKNMKNKKKKSTKMEFFPFLCDYRALLLSLNNMN